MIRAMTESEIVAAIRVRVSELEDRSIELQFDVKSITQELLQTNAAIEEAKWILLRIRYNELAEQGKRFNENGEVPEVDLEMMLAE